MGREEINVFMFAAAISLRADFRSLQGESVIHDKIIIIDFKIFLISDGIIYSSSEYVLHEINYKIVRVNHFYLYCEIWIFLLRFVLISLPSTLCWVRCVVRTKNISSDGKKRYTLFSLSVLRDDEFCFMTLSLLSLDIIGKISDIRDDSNIKSVDDDERRWDSL